MWTDSYVITTREFGPTVEYGIGVYGLEKNKMINGQPGRASVSFFLDGNDPDIAATSSATACCPPTSTASRSRRTTRAIPIVGTQDDGGGYGATFDALNIWDLKVKWRSTPVASLDAQAPSCRWRRSTRSSRARPTSRDCLPQPGITNPAQYLDILSLPAAADLAAGLPQLQGPTRRW